MIDKTITRKENYLPLQATNEVHFPHSHPPLYIFWDEKRHPLYSLLRQRTENRQDFSSLHRTISNLSLVKRNSYKMPYRIGVAYDRYRTNVNVFVARNCAIFGKFEYVDRKIFLVVTYSTWRVTHVNYNHDLATRSRILKTVKRIKTLLKNGIVFSKVETPNRRKHSGARWESESR